ncbi:MAG TPA: FecR family protein [Lacipirellulaceae bacterium]|nr:FecR family protein [Lacipirellulaceae bacterium]
MTPHDHPDAPESNPRRRLAAILDLVLDHQASEQEERELDALVTEHPELSGDVASQLRIHGWLQWESPQIKSVLPRALEAAVRPPGARRGARSLLPLFALAACLGFVALGAWTMFSGPKESAGAIAEIVDERLVSWSSRTDAVTPDRRIGAGLVAIDSGTLTLRFRSGATVRATGPASLRVESDMLVRLDEGQATAHVPHWARGFTIETPSAEIVDLGTEFGVAARHDGQTDVIVFDGEVDLTPLPRRRGDGGQKRLTKGEAVSITTRGGVDRIVQIQRDDRGEAWSTAALPGNPCMFAEIYDNLRATGSAMCYQVTPRGLAEDSLAYVDRPHQWNGLSDAGLPEFLRQADYVRTFNDDKYLGELEVVVELTQPAWLYLFCDDRVPLPDWIAQDFEDTGVDIGLDEGAWPSADMTLTTAVGSGQSVDRVFSVWRKRCEDSLTVRLGSLGASLEARAMYGLAAAPLE